MPVSNQLYTVADMDELWNDFELDCGLLVPVSRTSMAHGRMVARLCAKLWIFLEEHKLGEIYAGDSGCVLQRNPDTLRGADVAFISHQRLEEQPAEKWYEGAPDLAIEVMSANDRPGQIQRKISQFIDAGCSTVWMLNLKTRQVVVYHADGTIQVRSEGEVLEGEPMLPGFRWPVSDLFD